MHVGILVYEGVDELHVVGPRRVLRAAGFDVELVAEASDRVVLSEGLVITHTTDLTACLPLDVLLVTGGSSAGDRPARRAPQRNERTRRAHVTAGRAGRDHRRAGDLGRRHRHHRGVTRGIDLALEIAERHPGRDRRLPLEAVLNARRLCPASRNARDG